MSFAVIGMFLLTFANQMEIVSIGVIAQKGPDFFELFGPIKDNDILDVNQITKEQLLTRWNELSTNDPNLVTKEDTIKFMTGVRPKGIVDRVIDMINYVIPVSQNVKGLALMVALVGLLRAVALFWQRYATKLVSIRISRDLRRDYFEHIQGLPMEFYAEHNIGSLSSRVVTDAFAIAEGINAFLTNYLQTPFTIGTTLILCFLTSWQLSLMTFLGFPLIIIPILYMAKKYKKVSRQLQKNQENFASVLVEFLSGIQTVKIYAMEEFSHKKYMEQNSLMARLEQKSAKYDLSARPVVHSIAMFLLAGTLLYGLYVLKMNVPEILVYCGFLYIFYEPVKKFAEENSTILWGAAAAERMDEVLQTMPTIKDKEDAEHLETLNHEIEFKDVWFRYKEEWVLKGLNFKVERGKTVALVGPTGAGKSTIAQLIPRLYDVQKGEILIDGKPLNTFTQKSLRQNIAFVPQKPFLFYDTVSENISIGRPFSRTQVEHAARMAHAEEFIVKLPNKYDTQLSEAGKDLSGGQQQRLAIARALLKNSPILIMDEATSSLDAVSEDHIKRAISQLQGKVTQIIIAHRLSTIENADKIIYLEHGKKVAEGTRDELLKNCDGFRIMWEMMHRKTEKEDKVEQEQEASI